MNSKMNRFALAGKCVPLTSPESVVVGFDGRLAKLWPAMTFANAGQARCGGDECSSIETILLFAVSSLVFANRRGVCSYLLSCWASKAIAPDHHRSVSSEDQPTHLQRRVAPAKEKPAAFPWEPKTSSQPATGTNDAGGLGHYPNSTGKNESKHAVDLRNGKEDDGINTRSDTSVTDASRGNHINMRFHDQKQQHKQEQEQLDFLASMTFAGGLREPNCPCCI